MKTYLVLLVISYLKIANGSYGGNDIFTSLEATRRLWLEERLFVQNLQDSIDTFKSILPIFERYIANHKKLELDQEPNVEYLGHPINSYNLIKHSALGWKMFHEDVLPSLNKTIPQLTYVLNRPNNTPIPDNNEIAGAAFGIARLHTLYSLDTDNFVHNGIVDSDFGHVHVKSKPSSKKLSSYDLGVLGSVAEQMRLWTTAIPALQSALELIPLELSGQTDPVDIFKEEYYTPEHLAKELNISIEVHDQHLLRKGSRYGKMRLFPYPKGNKLSSKEAKKIAKREKKNKAEIIRKDEVEDPFGVTKPDHYIYEENLYRVDLQKEYLCTGKTFRNETELKDLKCFYSDNNSPWLALGPLKIEMQSHEPYLVVIRELMYPHECDEITQFLGPYLGAPPGRMAGGQGPNDWTMKNAWPNEDSTPALDKMTRRVEHITNLLASSRLDQSDNFMCGNYGIGGHYGVHPDYKKYSTPYSKYANINRVVTVMSILDAPAAGGATVWPYLGVNVFPEKGSAVWWFNTRSDSVPDIETKHAACPVLLGQKWIGNKWIGYKPQWRNRPCALEQGARYKGVFPKPNKFFKKM